MRNHSNENEFYLHENGPVGETHFHLNGFARRLDVKQRQRVTRKWPIIIKTKSGTPNKRAKNVYADIYDVFSSRWLQLVIHIHEDL